MTDRAFDKAVRDTLKRGMEECGWIPDTGKVPIEEIDKSLEVLRDLVSIVESILMKTSLAPDKPDIPRDEDEIFWSYTCTCGCPDYMHVWGGKAADCRSSCVVCDCDEYVQDVRVDAKKLTMREVNAARVTRPDPGPLKPKRRHHRPY